VGEEHLPEKLASAVHQQRLEVAAPLRHAVHRLVPRPGLRHVEGGLVEVAGLPLGEEEDRLEGLELLTRPLSEVEGEKPATSHRNPSTSAVDVLVHDAQFLEDERAMAIDYGHATVPDSVKLAQACRARHLVLFHHSPARTDGALDETAAWVPGWPASCRSCWPERT